MAPPRSKLHRHAPSGEALRQWREQQGLSQEQLAERIGVNRVTLARWEVGEFQPTRLAQRVLAAMGFGGEQHEPA